MATKKELAEQKREVKKATKEVAFQQVLGEMSLDNRERLQKVLAAHDASREKAKASAAQLSEEYRERLEAWKARDAMQDAEVNSWVVEIEAARNQFSGVKKAFRQGQYEALSNAYSFYNKAEDKDYGDLFYNKLAERLREAGIKIQSNTTDAALVARYIWGPSLSPAQTFKYGNVLRYARGEMVKPEDFTEWLKKTTISKAIEAQANAANAKTLRKERMDRARVVIMRYLELREVSPFAKVPMLAWNAEKHLSNGTNMHLMLGTAVRKMDRESDYADLLVSAILPANIGLDILILDRFARHIVDYVEQYEAEVDEMEQKIWADDLYERLWDAEIGEAEKIKEYWQLRMRASQEEDQLEFVKKVRKEKAKKQATSKKSASTGKKTKN